MKKTTILLVIIPFWMFNSCSIKESISSNNNNKNELVQMSVDFLDAIKNKQSTEQIKQKLAQLTLNEVTTSLTTDQERLAFWINLYNAYIQDILSKEPTLYEDRGKFFRDPRIDLLGRTFSFGEIEHGIIRRSQNEFGLGYLRKWFPPKWEKQLRVKKRDFRVHFALNCGAKDCPPVAIYEATKINDQLEKSSNLYLKQSSQYDELKEEVAITSLFSWFRGDFGGKKGTEEILKRYMVIPHESSPQLKYKTYDWTLYLGNFIEL